MKKFLAVFLTAILLFTSMLTVVASATSNKSTANEDKITNELKEVMADKKNNEYISIYIWLYDMGDEVVYTRLSNKLGKELNQDNEENYIAEKVKSKVKKYQEKQKTKNSKNEKFDVAVFRKEAEISEILTNDEIKNCIDAGKTRKQVIELSEQYQYLSDFRDSRAYVNASVNELFESSIKKSKCKNVNVDMLLPYVTMDCKKSYISKLSTMDIVQEIGVLEKSSGVEIREELTTEADTETDETVVDKYIMQPIDTPYTGAGIKVGVVEFSFYDDDSTHLREANINRQTNDIADEKTHSTEVLSILCGQRKSLNGIDYQGVAPDASIYFAIFTSALDAPLQWMIIEQNVSLINISLQIGNSYSYNSNDRYLDCVVQQYRTSIVKSSGNSRYITTPGMAYNIITVGNMSNTTDENGKYLINSNSSYEEQYCLTNKPDICAFGTDVHMLYNGAETNLGEGTSLAAPQVTGTIALMMEANPALIGEPHKVKSILLTSADDEHVSESDGDVNDDSDNSLRCTTPTYNSSYLESATPINRNKTGAGILNIKASVENALYSVSYAFIFISNGSKTTNEIFIPSNMDFKVGLVFEKADHDLIAANNLYNTSVDFEMIDINSGNIVFSSVDSEANSLSINDNVKVFDVSTKGSGTYVFKVTCSGIDISDESSTDIPEIHQTAHEQINVALSFTCSCLNPIRDSNIQEYSEESNAVVNSCLSNGCFHTMLTDITYYDELSWEEDFGVIEYTVTHKRSYSNEVIITDAKLDYVIYLNDLYETYYIRGTHGNIETVSYGYIDRYYFEVYVYDAMGKMTPFETAVEVEYVNTFDRVYVYPIMIN